MRAHARRLTFHALLIVLGGLTASILTSESRAQDAANAQQAGEITRLQHQIEELQARLKKVEEKFDKPLTVKAPFTVEDEHGKRVLRVQNEAGPEIALGNDETPAFRVRDSEEGVKLSLERGDSDITLLAASDNRAIVAAGQGDMYSRFFTSPGGSVVEVVQGTTRSQLGIYQGNSRVKLWQNNRPLFIAEAAAEPSLKLGDLQNPAFAVKDSAGRAVLDLTKGSTAVHLRAEAAQSMVDVVAAGGRRVQALSSANASTVKVVSGSGGSSSPASSLAMTLDNTGPYVDLARDGKKAARLGASPDSKSNSLRIYDEQGNLSIEAGLGEQDQPGLWLWRDGDDVASLRAAAQGGSLLEMFDSGGKLGADLVSSAKEPSQLRIYGREEQRAVQVGLDKDEEAAVLLWSDGNLATDISAIKGTGGIDLYSEGKHLAGLGIDSDGGGGTLELLSKSGEVMSQLLTQSGEGSLILFEAGKKISASLGPVEGRDTGLRMYHGGEQLAAIGIDTGGHGAVSLAHKGGASLAAIQTDGDGGQFVAFNKGGKPGAAVAVSPEGTGALEIFSSSGELIGSLSKGLYGGKLQLNSLDGEPMVEAGSTGGVGIVRTGPGLRRGGLMGLPGSFIMGKQ